MGWQQPRSIHRESRANRLEGRTETLHRLNRAEIQNAVRDLLALDIDIASLLVNVVDKLGIPVEKIGNSTGELNVDIDTLSGF